MLEVVSISVGRRIRINSDGFSLVLIFDEVAGGFSDSSIH